MITSEIKYLGNLRTECHHLASGTVIETDAPIDNKGKGERFSPTDLVATAYASCMMTIMGIYCNEHGIEDPCTEEANTDSESEDLPYDDLDWLDAVRSISPETPQGALLVPPAERLKKYRREAEDKLNSYKEEANKLATGMAKELELPAAMVPKIIKCLSGYDPDDFMVF